jgi:hypothetical protein
MPHVITCIGLDGTATKRTISKSGEAERYFNVNRQLPHVTFIQWRQPNGSVWAFCRWKPKPTVELIKSQDDAA